MRAFDAALGAGLVLAAACGGAASSGGVREPSAPTPVTQATTSTVPADGGTPGSPAPPSATAAIAEGTTPGHVEMRPPIASQMLADLTALGIDPKNPPSIEKLDPKALRGVMKLFSKSLGGRCGDCHIEGDFGAPTRRKKIAAKMWDEWAAKMTLADGSPLFCDSCHQGRTVLLDRTDKKALGKWMDASFVDGLKSKDQKSLECETCHVGMEMKFLSIWAG